MYIQEAHPTDGWQVLMNIDQHVEFAQPKTAGERAEVAADCMRSLDLAMPMLLDDMTNQVDTAYSALPDRLYLIGRGGRVACWWSGRESYGREPANVNAPPPPTNIRPYLYSAEHRNFDTGRG